jgi:iron complex outermembrane receptor protein
MNFTGEVLVRKRNGSISAAVATALLPLSLTPPPIFQGEALAASEGLEEIVVTARRREESLQNIPLSVAAFGSRELEERGVLNLSDLRAAIPNFVFEERAIGLDERPAIRGLIEPNLTSPLERNVSFFVNGIPVGGPTNNFPLGDIARIEVIRGPQSALFGRSTFSGAVNYVTRRPTEELTGRISASLAEHDTYELSGNVSGPLVADTLYFKAGLRTSGYGGEHRNLFSGQFYGDTENRSGSAGLLWVPNDSFELDVMAIYSEDRNGLGAYGQFPVGYKSCLTGLNPGPGGPGNRSPGYDVRGWVCGELEARDLTINTADQLYEKGPGYDQDTLFLMASATLSFDNGMALRVLAGFSDLDYERRDNQSRIPIPGLFGFAPVEINNPPVPGGFAASQAIDQGSIDTSTFELRLESDVAAPLRWVLGASWRKDEFDLTRLAGANNETLRQPPSFVTQFPLGQVAENYSVFGSVAYDFMPRLTGNLEMRYQEEEITDFSNGLRLTGRAIPYRDKETFDAFLPRLSLEYRPGDDLMLYGLVARGNKPGRPEQATNPNPNTAARVEEEKNTTYELGAKSQWADGRITANIAAFFIDWTNVQVLFTELTGNTSVIQSQITNAGAVDVYGMELETAFLLSENWSVNFNYGYTKAEFKRGYVTPEATELLGVAGAIDFLAGKRPRYLPDHMIALSSAYRQSLGGVLPGWQWFVRGDANYESKKYATELNTAWYGNAVRVNLRLGIENDNWSVAAWVRNLFDDDTLLSSGRFTNLRSGDPDPTQTSLPGTQSRNFVAEGTLARGRQLGLSASYRF